MTEVQMERLLVELRAMKEANDVNMERVRVLVSGNAVTEVGLRACANAVDVLARATAGQRSATPAGSVAPAPL
jgi:hypothetical protein